LLTLFGTALGFAAILTPASGVAASTNNFGLFVSGIAAPILYASAGQINLQVPYEIESQSTVQMQLMSQETPLPDSKTMTLAVQTQQPSLFLSPAALTSQFPAYTFRGSMFLGVAALAVNADGTVNDCTNPAPAGSIVTVFANGMGQVTPVLSTGAIAAAPPLAIAPGITVNHGNGNVTNPPTLTLPGSIDAVAQVQVQWCLLCAALCCGSAWF
jgi:uncharacterized protein (TIGR03437 family)